MSFTLPADLSSKLKAVNTVLSAIAEAPVSSLDTSQSVDVSSAVGILDEINLAVQSRGWHWNREEQLSLSPDPDGKIALPENCLWVANAYWENGAVARVVERARALYDRTNHTNVFTEAVVLDMVVLLDWEEMPEYARRLITIRAAKQKQGRHQGSSLVDQITDAEVGDALATMEQREDEADPKSQVYGNLDVKRTLSARGVRRR